MEGEIPLRKEEISRGIKAFDKNRKVDYQKCKAFPIHKALAADSRFVQKYPGRLVWEKPYNVKFAMASRMLPHSAVYCLSI